MAFLEHLCSTIKVKEFRCRTTTGRCFIFGANHFKKIPLKNSYFECQSGGVHCSNSLPGSSKYVCRNFRSSEDGTVLFGNPELRLAKASTTTSTGKAGNRQRVQEIPGLELFRWASEQIKHARLTRSCSQLHIYKVLVIIKQLRHLDLSQDFSGAVDLTGGNNTCQTSDAQNNRAVCVSAHFLSGTHRLST